MPIIHGVDLSRWQAGLTIADVVAVDVSFVNIALTKGLASHASTLEQKRRWAGDAWAAGVIVGGYHWLDGTSSGRDQWHVCAQEALRVFGTLDGWFLQLDCEDTTSPATQVIAEDFLRAASRELDRPVAFYTGDWWINPRQWTPEISRLAPYLWSAPESGRLGMAPSFASPAWNWTGFGGWPEIHLVQWSASQKIKGISVSSTVVRKPGVLTALCSG